MAFHFPSRPHPIIHQLDEYVYRLSWSKAKSTSSSTIIHKLSDLKDLHDFVDSLLKLPLTQQALAADQHHISANELLDGSLRLLDVCSMAKDALSQTKECLQDLLSVIRRRHGDDSAVLTSETRKYLAFRKTIKKVLHKGLENLKAQATKLSVFSVHKEEPNIVRKLRDVEAVTVEVFESMLCFISGPNSKSGRWSLVSKIVKSKKVSCDKEVNVNEFEEVDAALKSLKTSHNEVNNLGSCIQDQEEGIEALLRKLIKNRVTLLNILSH